MAAWLAMRGKSHQKKKPTKTNENVTNPVNNTKYLQNKSRIYMLANQMQGGVQTWYTLNSSCGFKFYAYHDCQIFNFYKYACKSFSI